MLGLLVANSYDIIVKYIRCDVLVKNTIERKRKLPFPAVTICNSNGYKQIELERILTGTNVIRKRRSAGKCFFYIPLCLHSAGFSVFSFFRNTVQYLHYLGTKTHNKCTKMQIKLGSKNKKHFATVLCRQYGPNLSIQPSKLRFSGCIDGRGPY